MKLFLIAVVISTLFSLTAAMYGGIENRKNFFWCGVLGLMLSFAAALVVYICIRLP